MAEKKQVIEELVAIPKDKNDGKSKKGTYKVYQIEENDLGVVGSVYVPVGKKVTGFNVTIEE